MRKLLSLTIVLTTLMSSCVVVKVPPGQARKSTAPGKSATAPGQVKKTTGSQSAAPYAPGQQKKSSGSSPVKNGSSTKKKN